MFTPAPGFRAPPGHGILEGLDSMALKVLDKPTETIISDDIQIQDVRYLGSYHWMDSDVPTIVVPGSPRRWLYKPLPFSVRPDNGQSYLNENEHQLPSKPLVPLMKAVEIVGKQTNRDPFKWSFVDLVINRRSLRNLLRWINGKADKDFRIDMQLVGSRTVLFNQFDTHTTEPVFPGFGFSFERAACETVAGCERGHTRIIAYDFNGLKIVLRCNVNAFLPSTTSDKEEPTSVDDLVNELANLGIKSPAQSGAEKAGLDPVSGLRVIRSGSANILQDSLLEIATRSEKNAARLDWTESYPQLFLSQTPNHWLAIHRNGRFHSIQKQKLGSPEMHQVEQEAQPSLKKLGQFLRVIQDLVIAHGETERLSLVCVKGVLKVFKRSTADSFLPDEYLARFREN